MRACSSVTHSRSFQLGILYIRRIYTSMFLYIAAKFTAFKGRKLFYRGPVERGSVEAQLKIMTAWDPSARCSWWRGEGGESDPALAALAGTDNS